MIQDIILPADPELEKMVLGCMIVRGDIRPALGVLDGTSFSNEKTKELWALMCDLHASGIKIDRVTVARRALDIKSKHITLSWLTELDDDLPFMPQLDSYINRVRDLGIRRRAIFDCEDLMYRLADPANDSAMVLNRAATLISALSADVQADKSVLSAADVIEEFGGLDQMFSSAAARDVMPTPWASIQERFIGFQPGRLYVIAGRPGTGKSAWALQVAGHAAHLGDHPYFVSMEMGREELIGRMISCFGGVSYGRLVNRRLSQDDRRAIAKTCSSDWFRRIRLTDDGLMSLPLLRSRLIKLNPKPKLVVVDYLQLMQSVGKTREQEVSALSRGLKLLAKEFGIAILALSQMNRQERGVKVTEPNLQSLRESGAIEQDADMVGFLHNVTEDDNCHTKDIWFLLKKQRNGPTGRVLMQFNGSHQKFTETELSDVACPVEPPGNYPVERQSEFELDEVDF